MPDVVEVQIPVVPEALASPGRLPSPVAALLALVASELGEPVTPDRIAIRPGTLARLLQAEREWRRSIGLADCQVPAFRLGRRIALGSVLVFPAEVRS